MRVYKVDIESHTEQILTIFFTFRKQTLKNISFIVPPGQTFALVSSKLTADKKYKKKRKKKLTADRNEFPKMLKKPKNFFCLEIKKTQLFSI